MNRTVLAVAIGVVFGAGVGVPVATVRARAEKPPSLSSEYQLVLLDNGQTFFGRLEGLGSESTVLHDVFYIQSQVDPDTKQPRNSLIKRGKEWHEPDRMVLSAQHIVLVEPVSPSSTVARLIRESKR
jgi:hypothetical protein